MKKEIICVICPRGCKMTVEGEEERIENIKGYGCNRGIEYAKTEFACPCRILTTSVPLKGGNRKMLPIRSSAPIPRHLLTDCMKQIKLHSVEKPVLLHQVIIENIMGTGTDMIACMTVK
jgi:CxxC motif-containing protein